MDVSLEPSSPLHIQKICIVGAGPTGLVAAKHFVAEEAFERIDVFEQQSQAGGVWIHSKLTPAMVDVIPLATPHVPVDVPLALGHDQRPVFATAMYDDLHTNLPKELMQFSDKAFPDDCQLFPTRESVLEYIQEYAREIKHLISYSTQVQDIRLHRKNDRDIWTVTTKNLVTSKIQKAKYDAILIASGHYYVPNIPSVPGIQAWNHAYPGVITHAKFYRTPSVYQNKKVVVVGNHASGQDIGSQISQVSQKPLLNSVAHKSETLVPQTKEEVGKIEEYIVEDRAVRLEDGRIIKEIDAVVYCTGYFYSYPFLKSLKPPVFTDGRRVLGSYKHLFSIAHPTLAFTGLPQKVVPFPISEAQSALVARVWSNRLELPARDVMLAWERRTVEEKGNGTSFHVFGYPHDANYMSEMHDWVALADGTQGKKAPRWGERLLWIRQKYVEMFKAFVETGGTAKKMEELGFHFEGNEG